MGQSQELKTYECRVGDQIEFLGCGTFEAAKRLVGS